MATERQHSTVEEDDWVEATRRETEDTLQIECDKLLKTSKYEDLERWKQEIDGFKRLFGSSLRCSTTIDWSKIEPLPANTIRPYDQLVHPDKEKVKEALNKLVVVKLNGGLGTSMGCKGPKSLISVRNEFTFLDLTMQQIQHLNHTYDVNVPVVLMNSFNTDDDTQKILRKYRQVDAKVHTFNQSRYPRIHKESLMPIAGSLQGDLDAWYPPGHGNFYEAFNNSGLLDNFLNQGKEYVFVSNIDNMGATVDLNILNFLLTDPQQPQFVMEVTDKTRADVKGGTLIHFEDRLTLLEIAQVPKKYADEFKSVNKFRIFNTNNLWANMKTIKTLVDSKSMNMEIIVNPKVTDNGIPVLQLETAAGAAIKNFNNACAINVPRSRFLPVKKTQDLLLLMSNLYEIEHGSLTLSSRRMFPTTPIVTLGRSFDKVKDFLARFAGVPDMLELDHLTVSGDVNFGQGVTLKGTVIIIANHGDQIDIPAGAYLENKIVSGNLRILDH